VEVKMIVVEEFAGVSDLVGVFGVFESRYVL
jgi:hypothetical protein